MYGSRSKYKVRTDPQGVANRTVDNITFHSVKERRRYEELKLLERFGEITGLVLQKRFDLIVNGIKVCAYVADMTGRHSRLMLWRGRQADFKLRLTFRTVY